MAGERGVTPAFTIVDSEGNRTQQEITSFPFRIGRHASNNLILRDARASRTHAELTASGSDFFLEDLQSRHGVFVNGIRIDRVALQSGDRVEFGFPDAYSLIFESPDGRVSEVAEMLGAQLEGGNGLARLRAVLEVTRALQSSFSVDGVLSAVVDAALVITHAERGFLLIAEGDELSVRCARDRNGALKDTDLAVPRHLIRNALDARANTFSMQFDPARIDPSSSVYALDLKSVVCVPLVRVQMRDQPDPSADLAQTVGVLYLDSRSSARDMAADSRELLETLGIEVSTILEHARLLEDQRQRQHLQEELSIARGIQQSLLPPALPQSGWLRATGYSMPSRQVGGDYFDVFQLNERCWAAVVADVAGKGVSSALIASLLQGAFLSMDQDPQSMVHTVARVNAFFLERTEGEKHATLFCALITRDGNLHYINAGHCAAIVMRLHGDPELLPATAPPVGLIRDATYTPHGQTLQAGDRLLLYSDGVTESLSADGSFFGKERLLQVIRTHSDRPHALLHQAILDAIDTFTDGREQDDDLTLLVLEYRPDLPV